MAMQRTAFGTLMAIAMIGMLGTVLVYSTLTSSQTFNNTVTIRAEGGGGGDGGGGKVVEIGVYFDSGCTQKVSSLDWGEIALGESKTQTIYVRNEGSVPIVLSMTVGNWAPSNANVITVTWNRQGTTLSAGATISATIILTVPETLTGVSSFSFDITITGTEQT
jgi:hypothetical protein